MKNIFTLILFAILGLASCQQKEESPVTDNQATERHSCCDTTKMETLPLWNGSSYTNRKGISLPYITNVNDWYQHPCENPCFTFNNDALGTCDNNAIVDCLNYDVNSCSNKTALSSWICLGVGCLPSYCYSYSNSGSNWPLNFLYQGTNPSGCSGGARAFFELDPTSFCETMDCVSQMGIDYLYDNRTLYTCNNNVRPIIEYQLVAKTSGIASCQCYPGYEEYQGYNAELWVKIWCCND